MDSDRAPTTTDEQDPDGCPRCGALIADQGGRRHDAWHEFIESSITGLAADLATLHS